MVIARYVLVSFVVAVLVVAVGKTSFGHGGHGGSHEGHEAHHEAHPENHHEAHHEAHPENHHEAHHNPDHNKHYAHPEHHPWEHSWHRATAGDLTSWFDGWGWNNPVYYGYGPGGNVVYKNDDVYVNGNRTGTAGEYTKSASTLASVNPSSESPNDGADWLPLGTFALSRQGSGDKPSQVVQLAVDKSGAISGSLFNTTNDTSAPIHGSVDRATQRAAFALGDKSGLVAETGIYNLTRDKAGLLVHQGSEKPQHFSLTRLKAPPADTHDLSQSEK